MSNLQNLHTHTTFCDGKDTPEEMVVSAIEKGFDSIGFSGHSFMYYAPQYKMFFEDTEPYKKEINRLKEEYKDRIKIYCGLEFDMYSNIDMSGYDYMIGSVHFLNHNGKWIDFDHTAKDVEKIINEDFNGNGIEYAKAYYRTLGDLHEKGKFDIVGHFDLISKHSEVVRLFDEESKEYKNAVVEAAESLAGKIPFFEVNTGAIARGYRTTPYPSKFIIKELKRLGFKPIISSDCHDKNKLDCAFEDARNILKECGFKEKYVLTDSGFIPVEL